MDDQLDLIAKIPGDFEGQVTSKKWLERKEALSGLITMASKYDELDPKASYHNLCDTLKQILAKDANINVVAEAGKLLALLAKGLGPKFKDYGTPFIPVIFEKLKEKKAILRDVLVEVIDLIGVHSPLEQITEDIVTAMEKPNPAQKGQIDLFLSRYLRKFKAATAPKKLIKAVSTVLVKHCSDSDAEVRDAAMRCLGCIMCVIGEKDLTKLVGDLHTDNMKWGKIQEYKTEIGDLIAAEAPPPKPKKASSKKKKEEVSSSEEESEEAEEEEVEMEVDPYTLMEPFDVLSKLPNEFNTNIESKKWTERKEALDSLLKLCVDNPRLCPKSNYADIVTILKKALEKDANINVAAVAVKCLNAIANGLRVKFGPLMPSLSASIFDKFKEKKLVLREPLVELIGTIILHCVSIESLQVDVCAALAKPNPQIKAQTAFVIQRALIPMNATTLPKKFVKEVSVGLVKITGEADPEARDAACAALGSIMRIIGEKGITNLVGDVSNDKIKMAKIKEACDGMIEVNGPAAVIIAQPVAKSVSETKKAPAKKVPAKKVLRTKKEITDTEEESDAEPEKPLPKKASSKKVGKENVNPEDKKDEVIKKVASKKVAVEEEEEEKPAEVHLVESSNKNQRFVDESKLRLLKWNFDIPQAEHIQQLQMLIKDVTSPELFSQLYNKDFKAQLNGVEVLMTLPNRTAIINNSDLILKWITLRILETNPTVMLKVMKLASFVIKCYLEESKQLKDVELNSFMPYLLLKTGETKEPIRNAVKQLVFVVAELTSQAKVYPFLIDALKTKNSRMKAECLTIISDFLDLSYEEISAVPAVFSASFKTIATAISDRDNNVRTSALNCFVAAYRSIGQDVYKLAGKISDKDKGYLDERIKRSGVAMTSQVAGKGGSIITKLPETPVLKRSESFNDTMDTVIIPYDRREEVSDYKAPSLLSSVSVSGGDYQYIDIDEEFPDLLVPVAATEPFIEFGDRNVIFPVMEDKLLPTIGARTKPQLDVNLYKNELLVLDTTMRKIGTCDLKFILDGVKEIHVFACDNSQIPFIVMQSKADELITILADALGFLVGDFFKKGLASEEVVEITKTLCNAIVRLLNQPPMVEFLGIATIDYFFESVLSHVAQQQLTVMSEFKNSIVSLLNHFVVKLTENCNYNSVMEALTRTMSRHTDGQTADKIFALVRKCMDKLVSLTAKKKEEIDVEKCINCLTRIYDLFQDTSSKQFETQFLAIKSHIQRLVIADRDKVKEAVEKHGRESKVKTWIYAGKCVEKSAAVCDQDLVNMIQEFTNMSAGEVIKKVSSAPVMSVVWDAFWESGKAFDESILNSVLVNIEKTNPYLLNSLDGQIKEARAIVEAGGTKKWSVDILLKNCIILKGDRLKSLLDRSDRAFKKLRSIQLKSVPVSTTHSMPSIGPGYLDGRRAIAPDSLRPTAAESVSIIRKPRRLTTADRTALQEQLNSIRRP